MAYYIEKHEDGISQHSQIEDKKFKDEEPESRNSFGVFSPLKENKSPSAQSFITLSETFDRSPMYKSVSKTPETKFGRQTSLNSQPKRKRGIFGQNLHMKRIMTKVVTRIQ